MKDNKQQGKAQAPNNEAGRQDPEYYTAEELSKLFIRNCAEGYQDAKIKGTHVVNHRVLINVGEMKEWFNWASTLKIIKEHGHGIL